MMCVFGAGSTLGGPIAGWLVDHLGWPSSFWVQVSLSLIPCLSIADLQIPVIIMCITLVTILLPEAPIPPTHQTVWTGLASLDWAGTFLLVGAVTTLILGFSFHTSYLEPWSAPIVWGNLLAAVLAAGLLIYVEQRVERPIIPLSMFKEKHTAAVLMSGFFMSVVSQAFVSSILVISRPRADLFRCIKCE